MFSLCSPRVVCALAVLLLAVCGASAQAQNGDEEVGGIVIDAQGVVRPKLRSDRSAGLTRQRREAFTREHLGDDVQPFNGMRKVSLPRLERAYAALREAGQPVPAEMQYLAGLQRIDYLFVDPDGRDVVLCGPAEGFAPDDQQRMLGLTTGRPAIRLDDLVVALRAVARGRSSIGCSIDPEESRLAALQQYVRQNSTPINSAGAKRRYARMAEILGLERVSVWGVPDDSHFARVLVEADYTMKRISLGTEPSGVRGIPSYLSLITPSGNSMQRWWFAPYYEAIHAADDGTAFQITGQRVQLLGQEEKVSAGGGRSDFAFTRASTQKFAQLFTEHYPELAQNSPVFAQLQNLFDLAVVSALLQKAGVPQRIGWRGDELLDRAEVESYRVPLQVPSAAMTRPARGGTMLGLIGGVTLDPAMVVQHLVTRGTPQAEAARQLRVRSLAPAGSDAGQWWWD